MIGEQTINAIGEAVTAALLDNMPELDRAYAATEEGSFPISMGVKIRPCADGNRIEVSVGFVTSRVRASTIRIVNEEQTSFLDEREK
jgi:hypothetical protein